MWTFLLDTSPTLHHSSVDFPDLHPHGQVCVDIPYHVQHEFSQFQLLHGSQQMVGGYWTKWIFQVQPGYSDLLFASLSILQAWSEQKGVLKQPLYERNPFCIMLITSSIVNSPGDLCCVDRIDCILPTDRLPIFQILFVNNSPSGSSRFQLA